jgi:hypothetical protein
MSGVGDGRSDGLQGAFCSIFALEVAERKTYLHLIDWLYLCLRKKATFYKKGAFSMAQREVAHLLTRIEQEYASARRGLRGLVSGTARHAGRRALGRGCFMRN